MVKSNMERSQVGEIYTPSLQGGYYTCGNYDAKGSKRIHQARRYQFQVRVTNQREQCTRVSGRANIDECLQSLIRLNHRFYRFMYSTA